MDDTMARMQALRAQQDAETDQAARRAMQSSQSANPVQSFASGFGQHFNLKAYKAGMAAGANAGGGMQVSAGAGADLASPSVTSLGGGQGLAAPGAGAAGAAASTGLGGGLSSAPLVSALGKFQGSEAQAAGMGTFFKSLFGGQDNG